jgi:hypothetical protein
MFLATYAFTDQIKDLDAYSVALGNGKLFRNHEDALDWASDIVESWYVENDDYMDGFSSELNIDRSNFRDVEVHDFKRPDGSVFGIVCIRVVHIA